VGPIISRSLDWNNQRRSSLTGRQCTAAVSTVWPWRCRELKLARKRAVWIWKCRA